MRVATTSRAWPLPMRAFAWLLVFVALVPAGPAAWAAAARVATPLSATPYPGTITLAVDATDVERKVVRVHETVPVPNGTTPLAMALHYPEWLPGVHAPRGPLQLLAGLQLRAGGPDGRRIEWQRDPLDPYTFAFTVPPGTERIDATFDYLSPIGNERGRQIATPEIVGIQWTGLLLYPRGWASADIMVQASLTLPEGYMPAGALAVAQRRGGSIDFAPTPLDQLADAPLFAGRHLRRVDLDPGAQAAGRAPVMLNIVADTALELDAAKPEHLAAHAALVTQADRLFGQRPYAHYDFLLAVSDSFGGIGLEHQQSSENGVDMGYFSDWAKRAPGRDLLPHEYVHAWNGKWRRPADLATPTFNTPMQDTLLWVYEGQTQFWGSVLAARSGLLSAADARDDLAMTAAWLDARAGRVWRNLQDTTNTPLIGGYGSSDWRDWQRSTDYYDESRLIWIEADMLIREASNGARSMDDFARAFFAMPAAGKRPPAAPSTYTFDDVVRTLNAVQPHDWAAFLRQRLDGHGPGAPLGGITRGGWKLVYTEQPSDYFKAVEARRKVADFSHSIGITVGKEDRIDAVEWGGPAYAAALAPGGTLLAVNGLAYKADRLREAITAAGTGTDGGAPIELLMKAGDRFRSVRIDWRGGLRYPRLERIDGTPDRLTTLFAPL